MAGTITSANAVVLLSVATVFPNPIQIQGFDVDDIYDTSEIERAETKYGADGQFVAGFIYNPTDQVISLLPSSASVSVFDAWNAAEVAAIDKFPASMTLILPSLGLKYQHSTGFLMKYQPVISAGKVLKSPKYTIRWGQITVAPV